MKVVVKTNKLPTRQVPPGARKQKALRALLIAKQHQYGIWISPVARSHDSTLLPRVLGSWGLVNA